ncbi:MAG: hypothetical protein HC858_01610 [Brachymonas sp.]|nr:hypothetical protein [Brachymonas sp.]
MSAKETKNTAVQTTTHYWGYRELGATEMNHVGGGYDGDGDSMGDDGGMCDASAHSGPSPSESTEDNGSQVALSCGTIAGLATGGAVSLSLLGGLGPASPAIGALFGGLVNETCTNPSGLPPGNISDYPMAESSGSPSFTISLSTPTYGGLGGYKG